MVKQELEYKALLEDAEAESKKQKMRYQMVSWLRGAMFLGIVTGLYAAFFKEAVLVGSMSALLFGALFFVLLSWHSKIETAMEYHMSTEEVIRRYFGRLDGSWRSFSEDGTEFLTEEHPQLGDLDLLGKSSVFQYLCAANTVFGKEKLALHLSNFEPDLRQVSRWQDSVREWSEKRELSMRLQALSNLISMKRKKGSRDTENLLLRFIDDAGKKDDKLSIGMKILMWTLPFLTLLSLGLLALGLLQEITLWISGLCVILQAGFAVLGYRRHTELLSPLFSFCRNIEAYKKIFSELEKQKFTSEYMKELQGILKKNGGAELGLSRLESINSAVKLRYNGVGYLICSVLFMWDYHCADALASWRKQYGAELMAWMQAVGEIEALISLSILCDLRRDSNFPILNQEKGVLLNTADMKHPLIAEKDSVGNSFLMKDGIVILTGSNMSGKTTFMRSLGTNLMLAYGGGSVLAQKFEASAMAVFTSMRIEDDVNRGISTFYGELLRIKSIVEYSRDGKPMLALIDEIFKGTNSADRIIGAEKTLEHLCRPWVATIVSTHDFELCGLEEKEGMSAVNYHFEEYYENDEIRFDYRLKAGRCKTTNAKHLLRLAGIL